jgi:hypothetical protein
MQREENKNEGGQIKCKNGQIETAGDYYAKFDPQVRKLHKMQQKKKRKT